MQDQLHASPTQRPADAIGEVSVDDTASVQDYVVAMPPEILAQSLGEYLRVWWLRVRSGDSGVLPVVIGMIAVAIVFEVTTPEHAFLRPSNLVYILDLSTIYMVLAMAEIVVLLLGEVDLSVGAVSLFGGIIAYKLVQEPVPALPWWLAILAALAACGAIGAYQGILVSRLRFPSFVVTLAGFLLFSGVIILALGGADGSAGVSASIPNQSVIYNLVQGVIDPTPSWVAMAAVMGITAGAIWIRGSAKRRSGLAAPPATLTAIRIAVMMAIAIAVVAICNVNRANLGTIEGLPWVIPILLGVFASWTFLLQRTRFGRYVYAIGGNPEAAARAGINVAAVRTWAFVLCSVTAGIGGILLGSFFYGQYSTNIADPGQLVLFAIASAVIGGTSLFGGRGKPLHGILGGLVMGGIAYGVSLLGLHPEWEYIVPGVVLVAAVIVDVLSRRGVATTGRSAGV